MDKLNSEDITNITEMVITAIIIVMILIVVGILGYNYNKNETTIKKIELENKKDSLQIEILKLKGEIE